MVEEAKKKAQESILNIGFEHFGGRQDVDLWSPKEYDEKILAALDELIEAVEESERRASNADG